MNSPVTVALVGFNYMVQVTLEPIYGLTFGIEHVSGDEEDFYAWAVPIHLGFFRIIFIGLKDEE